MKPYTTGDVFQVLNGFYSFKGTMTTENKFVDINPGELLFFLEKKEEMLFFYSLMKNDIIYYPVGMLEQSVHVEKLS